MPEKYVIHPKPAPPRFRFMGKFGIIDWREDCSSCHNCVKRKCVFDLYRDETRALQEETGFMDYIYQCKGCLVCVQNCTKNILTRLVNPEYEALGDKYYSPDIILSTWYQAETGGIPVSGSGYGGKFTGTGFDSMWTDMSEIVRPTRDGIHGREYINTGVEIGSKLPHLAFDEHNDLAVSPPRRVANPIPLIFDAIPENFNRGAVLSSIVEAGAGMGVLSIVKLKDISGDLAKHMNRIIPLIDEYTPQAAGRIADAPIVLIPDSKDVFSVIKAIKADNGNRIAAVRVKAMPGSQDRIAELAKNGTEAIQLTFDKHGYEQAPVRPRHMRHVLQDIHNRLVKEGVRDQVTLMSSGGIALAEHMAKAVICGADLVAVDLPLLVALECRLCMECEKGEACQIRLDEIDPAYARNRIVNLIHAWRNQLLEMLGAMGIREARRLRGETGRCMFFEDIERESFGKLFGKRKEGV
jgi:Pyruvate/2-oxoacid:ferredoxin oxidoreductase delta subunit